MGPDYIPFVAVYFAFAMSIVVVESADDDLSGHLQCEGSMGYDGQGAKNGLPKSHGLGSVLAARQLLAKRRDAAGQCLSQHLASDGSRVGSILG